MKKLGCNASRDVPQMLSQKLLAIIQDGFPLVERPYKALAEMLNVSEQDVFDEVEKMRASGVIRRIGGVYDSKKLGFISRLCAGKVPASSLDFSAEPHSQTPMEKFAAVVMSEPAITHNYIRSHEYNVWFTVIAENESAIQTVVDRVCAQMDLHDVHVLTATKKYKINTVMGKGAGAPSKNVFASAVRQSPENALTETDRTRIHIACDDIPHSLTPFKDWGVSCDELCEDLVAKRMRRFGAILRHQDAGFPCNAMVCFRLDEKRMTKDERGECCGDACVPIAEPTGLGTKCKDESCDRICAGMTNEEHVIARNDSDEAVQPDFVVVSKSDLLDERRETKDERGESLRISSKTGEGLAELRQVMNAALFKKTENSEDLWITSEREKTCLEEALAGIDRALRLIRTNPAVELLAFDMQLVRRSLQSITGEISSEDVLQQIFAGFCIGK